jgi:hypothetical protein
VPSKYEPLRRHLTSIAGDRIRLSFGEIERILRFSLPNSARQYAPWWANTGGSHIQADAWMSAGWRTAQVDVPGERVTFEREAAATADVRLSGVQERTTGFLPAEIRIDVSRLADAAARVLTDYLTEADDDVALALSRALDDAALTRRRRLVDWFREHSPKVPGDSADLIREDRDER